jgi:6-phosphogluconate dehydrogenase
VKVGLIGAGKMGLGLAQNMMRHGHEVVVLTRSELRVTVLREAGVEAFDQTEAFLEKLDSPKIIWMMVPAGDAVDDTIDLLLPDLKKGDILIDGGNSHFEDSISRAAFLASREIHYLDVGTSGGMKGALEGACLMVGGPREAYLSLEPLFKDLSVEGGCGYFGRAGAGHYVKMIHNGIEYAMMQAISEGFEILKRSEYGFDLEKIAQVYDRGSIIEGFLMGVTARSLRSQEAVEALSPVVSSSGEGLWTVEEALRLKVPVETIALSLFKRYSSQSDGFGAKLLSMMRYEFGGHEARKED